MIQYKYTESMLLGDLISLFFPNVCPGCQSALLRHEQMICTVCRTLLPVADDYADPDNPIISKLSGRLPLLHGFYLLPFLKEGIVQRLMHQLKYNNRPDIGVHLGELLGQKLRDKDMHRYFDVIVPVPLHRSRQERRGYNQSTQFAFGLSNKTGVVVEERVVIRQRISETQTRKSRLERLRNVEGIFTVINSKYIAQKHVLLVDDVFTTGATLESCGLTLLSCGLKSLSVATLAQAR
ncbi:MAG: ComF family protein [Cyclobacteriaceae bacterium]|nr:ComF family protein [Cyclobacteriaceae bacterium]